MGGICRRHYKDFVFYRIIGKAVDFSDQVSLGCLNYVFFL